MAFKPPFTGTIIVYSGVFHPYFALEKVPPSSEKQAIFRVRRIKMPRSFSSLYSEQDGGAAHEAATRGSEVDFKRVQGMARGVVRQDSRGFHEIFNDFHIDFG